MKILRVAILASIPIENLYPVTRSGIKLDTRPVHPATCASNIISALSRRSNLSIKVFSRSRSIKVMKEYQINSVKYTFIPYIEPAIMSAMLLHIPAKIQFSKIIEAYEPDVVIGFGTESFYALVASSQSFPSIVFVQGILAEIHKHMNRYSKLHDWIRRKLEIKAVRNADGVIAETQFGKNWVKHINKNIETAVIPHIVDSDFFNMKCKFLTNDALSIGSITQLKGIDKCIEAISLAENKNVGLVVIGNSGDIKQYLDLSRRLSVSNRVRFTGFLSKLEIMKEMSKAKMLLVLSRMDTSPNVVSEAQAAGLPVIGSNAGGIPEMIDDGIDGYLVDIGDTEAIADKIDMLAFDEDLCRKLGLAGREKALKLNDADAIAELHEKFYRRIVTKTSQL